MYRNGMEFNRIADKRPVVVKVTLKSLMKVLEDELKRKRHEERYERKKQNV